MLRHLIGGPRFVFHVHGAAVDRRLKRSRRDPSGIRPAFQIYAVQQGQHLFQRNGTVQIDEGVGRGVVPAVGGEERLRGQVGDVFGIASGDEPVGRVREQTAVQRVDGQLVRIGESPFHLVEDNAPELHVAVLTEFVMPALLAEDLRLVVDGGTEDGVKVNTDKIHEVRFIPAADGIHGLVLECQGIEKSVQGAFHKLHERLLHGIAGGTAEHGMLEDMENAGVVLGQGGKGDGEGLVVVRAVQPDQIQTGPPVYHPVQPAGQLRHRDFADHFKSAVVRTAEHELPPCVYSHRLLYRDSVSSQRAGAARRPDRCRRGKYRKKQKNPAPAC